MARKNPAPDERQSEMLELPPPRPPKRGFKRISRPVWTKNKAKLIDRYRFYFVMITKHGTYIDGFAGPQIPSRPETWAANLVLKSKPRFLRFFYLFDSDRKKVSLLKALKQREKRADPKPKLYVQVGDFNRTIRRVLASRPIRPTHATFCLLDQRTFECHWDTVEYLAGYKGGEHNKIEIFYLLAVSWVHRSISGVKQSTTKTKLEQWWGGPGWQAVRDMSQDELRDHFCDRFKKLGYRSVVAWPIYKAGSTAVSCIS